MHRHYCDFISLNSFIDKGKGSSIRCRNTKITLHEFNTAGRIYMLKTLPYAVTNESTLIQEGNAEVPHKVCNPYGTSSLRPCLFRSFRDIGYRFKYAT
jgi:hypothetical protein